MRKILFFLGFCLLNASSIKAQGIHFSQYYNAPQLLNPANTGLMPQEDFSVGANYREQWTSVPAPFKTMSAHGDVQLLRNRNLTNWLGLGLAFFSDKAGQGALTLNKFQASLAYHIQLNDYNMISAGVSLGYVQRSIDFNKLTFDAQWDGFRFNGANAQQEPYTRQSNSYLDVMLGVNYAMFPNENFYMKIGAGLLHLNRPNESFYGDDNRLGIRPMANIDVIIKTSENFILNPSLYYCNQKGASELVFGAMTNTNIGGANELGNSLLVGFYYRLGESFIPVAGIDYNRFKILFSYDITTSPFSVANRSKGASELGIIVKGFYGSNSRGRNNYSCPRL